MKSEVKKRSYKEIDSIFQTRYDLISKNFPVKIKLIEEIIEHSFYLDEVLETVFSEEVKKTGKQLGESGDPKDLIPLYFLRNNHYLIASYKLAKLGLNNPSRSVSRAIFEGVTIIYLLYLTTRGAELLYKKQLGCLTPTEEKELKTKYGNLRPKKVREILYDDPKRQQIGKFYSIISEDSVHPSIIGGIADMDFKVEITRNTLDGIIALGAMNIIAYNEVYSDKLGKKLVEASFNLLDKVAQEFGGYMYEFVPNNPSLLGKLKIVFPLTLKIFLSE